MSTNIRHILEENQLRLAELNAPYDPITGMGSPIEREKVPIDEKTDWYLPLEMSKEPIVIAIKEYGSLSRLASILDVSLEELQDDLIKVRFKYDFEFWAYVCHPIQDAETGEVNKFKLRKAQRKVWKEIHNQIILEDPIRVIVGKARQWGGSTFANALHRWIQIEVKENWHSAICSDVEDQAKNIRGMSDLMYTNYPYGKFTLKPYQGSSKNKMVMERGCIVGVGSMEKPDNLRSYNFKMLHLTEVGIWKKTAGKSPQDLAQSLRSQVKKVPWSVIILESTAKGVGNFFHEEWKRAISKQSGYAPIFVPWWEIEMYQRPLKDPISFFESLKNNPDEYGMLLWELGATLEGINWYFNMKESENYDTWRMMSEFPSTWQEMFQSSGRRAFAPAYVQRARKVNLLPLFIGDIRADGIDGKSALQNIEFQLESRGDFWVWALPDKTRKVSNRYCVSVDIGGRSVGADYSVIRVFDRIEMMNMGVPEAIATWRGHLDQDLVCWKAAQIAKFYNNALLIPESNSIAEETTDSEGDQLMLILDQIVKYYDNIYCRTNPEKIRQGLPAMYGFMTSRKTKPSIISILNKSLRTFGYYEYDGRACDEFDEYEIKPNGTYGNVDGKDKHDDLVMSTAIGLWCCLSYMDAPAMIVESTHGSRSKIVSEASF